tara:strand:+ start:684 stop:1706 length:1023 start_codon:yes stop_codon:yes gene_type:complete
MVDAKLTHEEQMMARAINNATKARPRCMPNPWVGAVLVSSDGQVFDGFTQEFGGEHAETVCLNEAGEKAQGATLFVTLEPCSHIGKTGPCVERIIESRISRVVIGMKDPDHQVYGEGIKSLQNAGIDVVAGVLETLVSDQLAPYVHHRKTGRPYVVLKIATTLDGKVAAPDGSSQWITGPEARREGHKLRAYSDAICVGKGTVISDNPQLTVRDWMPDDGIHQNLDPRRVVLGKVPTEAAVHPCYEFTGDLFGLLEELGGDGVLQLLVEGGASTYKAFHDLGLVNEYQLFLAPAFMGGSDGVNIFSGDSTQEISDLWRGRIQDVAELGKDIKVTVVPEHN